MISKQNCFSNTQLDLYDGLGKENVKNRSRPPWKPRGQQKSMTDQ